MRPEHTLLLKAGADQLTELPDGLDWSRVVGLSERHRLTPALWVRLQKLGLDDVPQQVQEELAKLTAEHAVRGAMWSQELAWVLKTLDGAGAPVLVWKGPELQSRVDPEVPRMYRDLDVVIHLEDAEKVTSMLAERFDLPPSHGPSFAKGAKDIQLSHKESPLTLELHASFIEPLGMMPELDEQAWETSVLVDWMGAPARRLEPRLEYLMLCWHGARHAFFRLRWLAELSLMLRSGELGRASELQFLAEETVGLRVFALPIVMLQRAGLLVSDQAEWASALETNDVNRWAQRWAKRLLDSPLDVGTPQERNRRRLLELQLLPPRASSFEWMTHLGLSILRRGGR